MLRITRRRLFFSLLTRAEQAICDAHFTHVLSQTKDEVTDAAVDKLRAALGSTLSLETLLAAEEQVIVDTTSKVGFCRPKTQFVPAPSSRPLWN